MIRKFLNKLLNPYKLKIVRLKEDFEPILLSGTDLSPACLNYLANKQPIIISVPLEKGRSLPLHSLSKASRHPYVVAVRKALNSDKQLDTIKETLKTYYQCYQPSSAAALLGLSKTHSLNKEPYWAITLPWNVDSVEQMKDRIQHSVNWENKSNGVNLRVDDGWAWAGPVSEQKLEIETKRVYKTFNSILKNGYNRNNNPDGDIQAYALMLENGEWIWQAQVGLHRSAVIAGLDYESIPVRLSKIIYRTEVESWPNVISGLYTKAEALKIFDMIFTGNFPTEATEWITKSDAVLSY